MKGRCIQTSILGISVVLLEVRYVDDYVAIWKFAAEEATVDITAQTVSDHLRKILRDRYPLPLEDDLSEVFIGLEVGSRNGQVCVAPTCAAAEFYDDIFDYPASMSFRSYSPMSMKRSLVLGILARVDRNTTPASDKPVILRKHLTAVASMGFQWSLLRKWCVSKDTSELRWVRDSFAHPDI